MTVKCKALLAACAAIVAVVFFGCALAEAKEKKPDPYTAAIMYVCPKCKAQIKRVAGQPKGFVGTCPKCGEKFLTF